MTTCFLIEPAVIRYLLEAALEVGDQHYGRRLFIWEHRGQQRKLDDTDTTKMGQMLHSANAGAVWSHALGTFGSYPVYEHRRMDVVLNALQILKTADYYENASSDVGSWLGSEARTFIDALRAAAWKRLPGYRKAEWGAPKVCERCVALQVERRSVQAASSVV